MREEQISQKRPTPEKYDPTLLPYETYKVDFEFFRLAFIALSPWGKGSQAEFLATQIFRVSKVKFLNTYVPDHKWCVFFQLHELNASRGVDKLPALTHRFR